jgi:nucleotide-binding universal stress UspA family protein
METARILVGFAGDGASRDALALAILLARVTGADLVVAGERLEEARSLLPYGSTAALQPLDARDLARRLRELAEEEPAELIVGGGDCAGDLLHHAPCAIAIAPPGYADEPAPDLRVIGVAYDGSDEARAALGAARDLAMAEQATIRLIGVAEPFQGQAVTVAAMSGWAEPRARLRDAVHQDLEVAAEELPHELRPQVLLADGDPAGEIVKRAGVLSLLVIGSRGYGPVRRALLGSVSRHVIRAATCPVLVVPRGVRVGAPARAAVA